MSTPALQQLVPDTVKPVEKQAPLKTATAVTPREQIVHTHVC